MIRISVIMGIYNCASTLAEALDSLLNQSYQGFKVIMCDDGSSDDTYKIAEDYVKLYPNKFILIKNEKNMGLNYTLNHCLEYVDTEYVARMDGDDISLPTRFEKEINFLDSHPQFAIVSTTMIYFDEWGIFHNRPIDDKNPKDVDFANGSPFCHAPCMVRTEAYKAVGGYSIDNKLLRVEDYHLWIKMYAKGFRGHIIGEPLYKMRDDRNAMIRRTWRNRINETYVRFLAFKYLSIPFYKFFFILRPIIVGLLPKRLYLYLHYKNIQKLKK